ncbi:MAG: class I SAM-dependent methyltransferase [Candidatus Hodarchaeota archaeon]
MDPELQAFTFKIMKQIIPDVEGIIKTYNKDPEKGFKLYLKFIKKIKPSLEKIIMEGLRFPMEVGVISPRLLRDPMDTELIIQGGSSEAKEAHLLGYLKAILQLLYCVANGLEVWEYNGTVLHEESLETWHIRKIDILNPLIKVIKQEISELGTKIDKKQMNRIKKKEIIDSNSIHTYLDWERNHEDEDTAVPFTARLMAYYRAKEYKNDSPLISDPFAEKLAGDMSSYVKKHRFVTGRGDYPLVRSYYLEKNLLAPWCKSQVKSQIVLLGAGLDTRAYRFIPLQTNSHFIFEIDFSSINQYKEEILKTDKPLCRLTRISSDLSQLDWSSKLIKAGFSFDIPTFWILEGVVYYMKQDIVKSLLKKAAEICTDNSQIFVDICFPALADLSFGPFTRYFKWGLEKKSVSTFFKSTGWEVSCFFADNHDQGRDVGQRGMIFVHGIRIISI